MSSFVCQEKRIKLVRCLDLHLNIDQKLNCQGEIKKQSIPFVRIFWSNEQKNEREKDFVSLINQLNIDDEWENVEWFHLVGQRSVNYRSNDEGEEVDEREISRRRILSIDYFVFQSSNEKVFCSMRWSNQFFSTLNDWEKTHSDWSFSLLNRWRIVWWKFNENKKNSLCCIRRFRTDIFVLSMRIFHHFSDHQNFNNNESEIFFLLRLVFSFEICDC